MKIKKFTVLLLACAISLPCLSSCGKTIESKAYGLQNGSGHGDYVTRIDMSETKGYIDSISIQETYTPCTWANIDPNELSEYNIDTIQYEGIDFEGNAKTYFFAEHIKIGDSTFTGSLRPSTDDNAAFIKRGEVIKYSCDNPVDTDDARLDLNKYLMISDSDTYKLGSRPGWYFEAVANDEIGVYGYAKDDADKTLSLCDYTLGFLDNEKFVNDASMYSGWNSSTEALCDYLVGKRLDFKRTVTDDDYNEYTTIKILDGTWHYSPTLAHGDFTDPDNSYEKIENCLAEDLPFYNFYNIMTLANKLFASMEYESTK